MGDQNGDVAVPRSTQVKATLCLGLEKHHINGTNAVLSEQLISMKRESMMILKDFITKHNIPNDVPDEAVEESSSEDDDDAGEALENLSERSKKRK
ncbi:hypothetical protein BVC80_1689g11 [Macleaya cordata]|uniref:Uncharacterized protein n=1 Tax=Macleaya cordata TaxID=56857 RepID=A0A200RAT4_MACCD|nr:hypothetical protein BVC80_1689g11 [Macleaya cordata]